MPFFGVPIRNGLPIGLGSVAGFGVQQFDPSQLFEGGTVAGAWYDPSDLSTMFDTSTGTTPVAMPGQGAAVPVGLMLDKSQGLVLGSELLSNGDFSNGTTGWSAPAGQTLTVENGAGKALNTSTGAYLGAPIAVVSGTWYKFTYTAISDGTSKSVGAALGSAVGTGTYLSQTDTGGYAFGTRTFYWLATVTGTVFPWFFAGSQTGTNYILIDNVSVKALPGNHAIAANDSTKRPVLMARVNLLTRSEEFNVAPWTNLNAVTVTANQTTAPDGTLTADSIAENTVNTTHFIRTEAQLAVANTAYIFSLYVKNNNANYITLSARGASSNYIAATFTLTGSGAVTSTSAAGAGYAVTVGGTTITDVGDGWFRCVLSGTMGTNVSSQSFFIALSDGVSAYDGNGIMSYLGTSRSAFIWGADLRPANIGANVPAYQRIADALTYDTSNFPLYLRFDGIDDSMYTPANLNLSGTDKVTVFAGVRKLSDAAQGIITELSAAWAINNGTFTVQGPVSAAPNYYFGGKGDAVFNSNQTVEATTFTAPITNILACSYNISGDLVSPRINGAATSAATGDQGSGNFGNYPLNIGVRSAASLPLAYFNGHLHGLIVVGSAVSAGNISATEQWVAGKTGITI